MAEHDGLTFAPVLVVDFNAVFGCNRAHVNAHLGFGCRPLADIQISVLFKSAPSSGATMTVIPAELKTLIMVKSAATIVLVHAAWVDGSSLNATNRTTGRE